MKYKKRHPETIDAWQFTKKNFKKGIPDFIWFAPYKPVNLWSQFGGDVISGEIKRDYGVVEVHENDFIVKKDGKFYVYEPEFFKAVYKKA